MKRALGENGEVIEAGAGVAPTAVCPTCGCRVRLRSRRRMGGGVTYFWRHAEEGRVPCRKRSRPFSVREQGR